MRVDKLIERLKKWPPHFQVVNEQGAHATSVNLDRVLFDGSKDGIGRVWIRFIDKTKCPKCRRPK